jgi:hypothetical protein
LDSGFALGHPEASRLPSGANFVSTVNTLFATSLPSMQTGRPGKDLGISDKLQGDAEFRGETLMRLWC